MGFAYTLGLALVVRTLGVLVFGLCAIAGQLAGALLLDIVAPGRRAATSTWQLVIAVALTLVAVPDRRALREPLRVRRRGGRP